MEPKKIEEVWREITVSYAETLACLADNLTEGETAKCLDVSVATIHNRCRSLRHMIGVEENRQMGPWWRDNALGWAALMANASGVKLET